MDLRQAYKATIEALEKEENEIVQLRQLLLDKEATLNLRAKELAEAIKQLESEQRLVKDVKDVKALKEFNSQRTHDLNQVENQLKMKEVELKKYENKLFEIKGTQDETDKQLRERETEVSHREKTYREEIEKSFASNLAKNLLNK